MPIERRAIKADFPPSVRVLPARPALLLLPGFRGEGFRNCRRGKNYEYQQHQHAEDSHGTACGGPAEPAYEKCGSRRKHQLPDIPRDVENTERRSPEFLVRIAVRNQRGGNGVLHTGAEPAKDQEGPERKRRGRPPVSQNRHAGEKRSRQKKPDGPDPGGQVAAWHLEGGKGPGKQRLEKTDLGEIQSELNLPHRKENIEHIGEAVMGKMGQPTSRHYSFIFQKEPKLAARKRDAALGRNTSFPRAALFNRRLFSRYPVHPCSFGPAPQRRRFDRPCSKYP